MAAPPPVPSAAAAEKRSELTKYEPGDWFSRIEYCKILRKDVNNDKVRVRSTAGREWDISAGIVENQAWAAKQFTREEAVTRTEMGELLAGAGDAVFCVTFTKQVQPNEAADKLAGADISTQAKRRKLMRDALTGQDRTMVGHLQSTKHEMGRYAVTDLEQPEGGFNRRLVDTRTLVSLTLKNVKYTLKK